MLDPNLRNAGYDRGSLQAQSGWDASLAQMVGLWARRRRMPQGIRAVLSLLLLSIARFLAWSDHLLASFESDTMMKGIWGTVVKKGASA